MATAQPNNEGKREGAPGKVSASLAQARQHLIRNNAAAALTVLKDIAALPDCPADVRLEAAKMLATAGANAEAAQCYLNAGLAMLYDQGDVARARQAFASAHNLDPHNLDVIFHLGQADVVEGRTQDGLAKFIDVLRKSNLKHTPALFEAGCIYQANGQYDQAILAFKKVLDREKDHIQAIVHMGQLHQIKGMIPEAIGYYVQAAQITRQAQQLGTTRQIVNMILSLDANNPRARSILADLDETSDEEGDHREEAPPAPAVPATPQAAAPEAPAAPPASVAPPQAPPVQPPPAAAKRASAPVEDDAMLADVRRQQEAAQAQLQAIQAQVDAARQELEAASVQRKDLERQGLDQIEAQSRRTREEAERDLQRLRQQIETDAQARREELDAELREMRAQIDQARVQQAEAAATRDAIATASAELDAKLQRVQRELSAAEAQRTQTAVAAAASSQQLESKTRETKTLVAREEARLKELQAQAAQAQANLSKASAAHEAAMLEIAARRQRAQAELDALQQDVDKTKREKDAQRERAELSVSELERKAEQLKTSIANAEAKRAKSEAEATAAKTALEALDQRLAAERAKAETATADLKDIVDEARRAQTHASDLSAKLAELQAQIQQAEGRKRTLEDSIGKVKPLAASAEKRRTEAEAAAAQAEKKRDKTEADLKTFEARKRELEEMLAKLKSLQTAAEQRRLEHEAAAEQAEALRTKREADAEALGARIAGLESSLKDADARAKASAAESATLAQVTKKVEEQKAALAKLEARRQEVEEALAATQAQAAEVEAAAAAAEAAAAAADERRAAAERSVADLEEELKAARSRREQEADEAALAAPMRPPVADIDAEAVALVVAPESCVESLRTIETLAADGELTIDAATEMAGLIHEGRAPAALREARKQANLAAQPAPYLLVCGDLARDLGDVAAAREAYRTLALADPSKAGLAQARMGDLFIAFAERSTAAALQRDDAHFAAAGDPAKAIAPYADLVARFPDDPTFREELGAIHEQLGNATAAALAYTQAMVGYLGSDDVARAVELAPKLLAAPSGDGAAYELAARAFERAGHKAQTQSALDRALRAYHEHHAASDVERVCRHLAEIADDPVPYRRELSRLLGEAGDHAGAAEQLVEAAEKLIAWSRGADAHELLREAAAMAPDDEITAARIASLQARADDVQRSVDDIARGDLLVSKEQYERAAEAYRRALEENPAHAGAAYRLAVLLMDHLHDDETAEKLLQTASELRPDHAATRYRLALVKAARGQVVEAVELLIALARFDEANADFIEQFAERLEKDAESGDVAAKYRLGIGYRELGRVDEALVILQSIQREADYVVLCHNAIGLCLRRQGLDTAAAKRFSKAIETPGYPEAQYHEALYNLGELYLAKTTPESLALALASFEELYASDCTFKDVGDRIKSVKARMGAVDRPKVKRLPTRTADLG